jgi:alpha-tubulin suppressor-like RCC1 family protein
MSRSSCHGVLFVRTELCSLLPRQRHGRCRCRCRGLCRCRGGAAVLPVWCVIQAATPVHAPAAFCDVVCALPSVRAHVRWLGYSRFRSMRRVLCVAAVLAAGIAAIAVAPPSPCGTVAAGSRFTCAIVGGNRTVYCWGSNDYGQLGHARDSGSVVPVHMPLPVQQVVAGESHACALLINGAVRCWGSNSGCQIGYGHYRSVGVFPSDLPDTVAGDVPLPALVMQLAAGSFHTCALLSGGSVRCWGLGADGQLGINSESDIGCGVGGAGAASDVALLQPEEAALGLRAVALAAGGFHSCALLSNGDVRCWGSGAVGQLGYGSLANVGDGNGVAPRIAGSVSLSKKSKFIAAGAAHTCAVLEEGNVTCWGLGSDGTLGYGNEHSVGINSSTLPSAAGSVAFGSVVGGASQLALGAGHTCALLANGAVRCWGANNFGQLGYGDFVPVGSTPLRVPSTIGDVNVSSNVSLSVIAVAAGGAHSCALLSNGDLQCWGANDRGQLGNGGNTTVGATQATLPASGGIARLPEAVALGCYTAEIPNATQPIVPAEDSMRLDASASGMEASRWLLVGGVAVAVVILVVIVVAAAAMIVRRRLRARSGDSHASVRAIKHNITSCGNDSQRIHGNSERENGGGGRPLRSRAASLAADSALANPFHTRTAAREFPGKAVNEYGVLGMSVSVPAAVSGSRARVAAGYDVMRHGASGRARSASRSAAGTRKAFSGYDALVVRAPSKSSLYDGAADPLSQLSNTSGKGYDAMSLPLGYSESRR